MHKLAARMRRHSDHDVPPREPGHRRPIVILVIAVVAVVLALHHFGVVGRSGP